MQKNKNCFALFINIDYYSHTEELTVKKFILTITLIICLLMVYYLYFVNEDTMNNLKNLKDQALFTEKKVDSETVSSILSKCITTDMSDYEKAKAIHDYIIITTEYDHENLEANTIPNDDYTAYGALVNHLAVCRGYAEAYKLLTNKAGLNCEIETGISDNISHAWNVIELDGKWYQVDVTFDDPVYEDTRYKKSNVVHYDYFLVTNEQMYLDHNPDKILHECIDDSYMYMEKESGVPFYTLSTSYKLAYSISANYGKDIKKATYYFPDYTDLSSIDFADNLSKAMSGKNATNFAYTPVTQCGKYYYTTVRVE